MPRQKRIILLITLALIGIGLGALREFIFVNLNYWIDHISRSTDQNYAHSIFNSLQGLSLNDLKTAKWVLAILFVAIMFTFSVLFITTYFNDRSLSKWVVICYIITLVFCSTFYMAHLLGPKGTAMLAIAVKALHALQYPFFVVILIPAISLFYGQRKA